MNQLQKCLRDLQRLSGVKPRKADDTKTSDARKPPAANPAPSKKPAPAKPAASSDCNNTYHWAKGTGFGNDDYGSSSSWDIHAYLSDAAKAEEQMATTCTVIATHISKLHLSQDAKELHSLSSHLEASCLVPFLHERLTSSSLIDLERQHKVISAVLALIKCLSQHASTARLLLLHPSTDATDTDNSLAAVLNTWHEQIQHVEQKERSMLKATGTKVAKPTTDEQAVVDLSVSLSQVAQWVTKAVSKAAKDPKNDDNDTVDLTGLDPVALARESSEQKSLADQPLTDKTSKPPLTSVPTPDDEAKSVPSPTGTSATAQAAADARYVKEMKPLQVCEVSTMGAHKYKNTDVSTLTWGRKWVRRVATEYQELGHSLPLYPESSVFLRYNEDTMCFAQMLIVGPEGTPYSGGMFLFDLYLPPTYPAVPPQCNLQTTGKGSVYFNPNLYSCGKVCLSLLGTWGGDEHESWNAATSTLLQLAVSIQSLILVPEPYFNEPGYEVEMGTPGGDSASEQYNANIRPSTVQWAMIDMLQNPPLGFEEVVRKHFKLRRQAILKQVEEDWKIPAQTLSTLKKELDALEADAKADAKAVEHDNKSD